MRILCTGGTSFIGAPFVRKLIESGYEVRALVREDSRAGRLKDTNCRLSAGDVRDPHAVSRAAFGCDSVVHLAYAPVSAPPREIMDTAVNGMGNVLRACELHGIDDLMMVSSPRSGNGSYYGTGKMAAEMMMSSRANAFRRALTARVFNAYGPDMGYDHVIPQFIIRMLGMHPGQIRFPIRGSGCDRRSFLWIDDCAEQLLQLYRHGSPGASRYDVGDPTTEVAIGDLARLIARQLDREIDLIGDSSDHRLATAQVPQLCGMLAALPHTDFNAGLPRVVAWYRENQGVLA